MSQDERWMRAALEWSWRGKGWVSPRPSVGCVLVRDGQILGGGHTQPGDGNPHGEVMALRAAWKTDPVRGARGATAYVTLEPCSHWGTTPPCCEFLAREGVIRVVAGVLDPDPRVAGRGYSRLEAAGIALQTGVLGEECFRAMDDFLFHIVQKRPFVTLKSALSLDGKIALADGQSKWLTGPASRQQAHRMRHHHDAVLVGIQTVLTDDPQLSVRLDGNWKQPRKIVVDSGARLPSGARIWDGEASVIVATLASAPQAQVRDLRERGAIVLQFAPDSEGRVPWAALLEELYALGIFSILIEGGAVVAGSALKAQVVNKVAYFLAPLLVGEGKSAIEGVHLSSLSLAPRLTQISTQRFEDDFLVEGYVDFCQRPL